MATLTLWLLTPLTEIEVSGLIVRLSSCMLLVWLIMTVFWRAPMLGGTLLTSLCVLITLLAFGATGTASVTLVHIIAVAPVGTAPMLVGAAPLCVGGVLPVGQVGVDTVDNLTGPPYNVSGICGIGNTTVVTGLDRAGVPPVGVVTPLVNLTGLGGTTTLVAQQVVAGAEGTPTTALHGAGTWNTSVTGNVTVTVGIAASACPAVGDVVPLIPLSAPSGTSTYHSPLNVSTCPCFDIWNPPLNDGVSTSTASIAIGGAPCGLAVVPRGAPDAKSTLETRPIEWLGALLQGVNSDPWVSSRAPVSLKGVMARLGNVNKICAWEGVWPEEHHPVGDHHCWSVVGAHCHLYGVPGVGQPSGHSGHLGVQGWCTWCLGHCLDVGYICPAPVQCCCVCSWVCSQVGGPTCVAACHHPSPHRAAVWYIPGLLCEHVPC